MLLLGDCGGLRADADDGSVSPPLSAPLKNFAIGSMPRNPFFNAKRSAQR